MVELSVAGKHLGLRLRDVAAALDRLDAFAFDGPARGAATPAPDATAPAETFVVRALRAGCDPDGWPILDALRHGDLAEAALVDRLGADRLVAWERVNQLVQVGLVARDLPTARVGLTPAGSALVEIVAELAAAADAGPAR